MAIQWLVYSKELKWLPKGSEFIQESDNPTAKPITYTSFSSSQDSMPEFSNNPVGPTEDNIIIAKLGPGQVRIFLLSGVCLGFSWNTHI